jgi:hypothetical protein
VAPVAVKRLLRERNQIAERMSERGWPRIVFGSIGGLGAAAAAVASPLIVDGGVATSAFAAPGLLPALYVLFTTVRRDSGLDSKPMAYAAVAQRTFGP